MQIHWLLRNLDTLPSFKMSVEIARNLVAIRMFKSFPSCCVTKDEGQPLKIWPEISNHDDVVKWKHFPRYWPLVRGIHRWPVNSPQRVNNREAGDLTCDCAHYVAPLMVTHVRCLQLQLSWLHLTQRNRDKKPSIYTQLFENAYSLMKIAVRWLKFHQGQHWFR